MKKQKLLAEINILNFIVSDKILVEETFSINYLKYLKKKLIKSILNPILEHLNSLEWVDEIEYIESVLEQTNGILDNYSLQLIRNQIP
jgi:hypothetical protein